MKKKKQFAALPYRTGEDGDIRVLLITSRDTGRWVVPKGWPMKNRRPHRAAAIEAFEEAGVVGTADKRSVGAFCYDKRLPDGEAVPCNVTVFPLEVKRLLENWPESDERIRRWFTPDEAAALVEEAELAEILTGFELDSVSGR